VPPVRAPELLARDLLTWYRAHARDLPWRRTRDPYAVWISEAMLQQTRVETVVDYWRRFLARFPRVEDLAAASEDEVLALWSGLGYYRRARSLVAAARAIVAEHGGRFPRDPAAARALPGVGPYTAGAVLSIAHDLPEALVDGNVERVFGRLLGLELAAGSAELRRRAWEIARELVPRRGGAGEWNQALMELGATTCTPRAPRCPACPLSGRCAAHRTGRAEELPLPKASPATVDVALELLVVERAGRLLLERRGDLGRMAGLWQFPTREEVPAGAPGRLFPAQWPSGAGLEPRERLFDLRHAITHHRIRAVVRRARIRRAPAGWRWTGERERAALGLTGMARKVLRALQERGPCADRSP